MKKMLSIISFVFLAFFSVNTLAASDQAAASSQTKQAENTVTLNFFYSKDCPHCVAAHPFIDKLKAEYPWLRVHSYEVSGSPKNGQLFEKMTRAHGKEPSFFPTFIVGDKVIVGYTSADTTGSELRDAVNATHNQ